MKQLLVVVFSFLCIYGYSQEGSQSLNHTESPLPVILIMDTKLTGAYFDLYSGEKMLRNNVLSIIESCPGNEEYLKKRKAYEISSYSFFASGIVMMTTSIILSGPLFSDSTIDKNISRYLMYGGGALSFTALGLAFLENQKYIRSVNNYNLWIMGIPFEVKNGKK